VFTAGRMDPPWFEVNDLDRVVHYSLPTSEGDIVTGWIGPAPRRRPRTRPRQAFRRPGAPRAARKVVGVKGTGTERTAFGSRLLSSGAPTVVSQPGSHIAPTQALPTTREGI